MKIDKKEMADILGNEMSNASSTTELSPLTHSKHPTSSINKTPSRSSKSPCKSFGNKCSCKVCQKLRPKPDQAPNGKCIDVVETQKITIKILKKLCSRNKILHESTAKKLLMKSWFKSKSC